MSASRALSFTGFLPSSRSLSLLLQGSRMLAIGSCLALTLAACGGGGGGAGFGNGGTGLGGGSTVGSGSNSGSGTGSGGSTGNGGGTAPTTPVYSVGTGSGSGFKDGAIDINKATLNSGETATLRVNVVDQANNPPAVDLAVVFTSTCTSTGLAGFGTVTQVTRGLFSVDYTNRGCDKAEDIVVATLSVNGDQASTKIKMVGPDVISVSFVSATPTQLALAGIGGTESAELIFQVSGPQGVPVTGKAVDFAINSQVGGASILGDRASATSDQGGQVRTIIKSGTVAGPINVKATERSTGKQGISPDIIVTTGVVDDKHFSLSSSSFNPPDAVNKDGVSLTLNIIASDIFGNDPPNGTRITFVSPEGGNVTSSCALTNGTCSVRWLSGGVRPSDNRISLLAYTNGAETFVDQNGNGVYDSTDGPITDLDEPWADTNSNGVYDLTDFFFDVDKDGVHDIGNGKWDGPCLNKVDARAICDGTSTVIVYRQLTVTMPVNEVEIKSLGTFPAVNSKISIKQGTTLTLGDMVLRDSNAAAASAAGGNPLPAGTTIAFSTEGTGVALKGTTSINVINALTPEKSTGPIGVTIAADAAAAPLSTDAKLLMKVTFTDASVKEFRWPIEITP